MTEGSLSVGVLKTAELSDWSNANSWVPVELTARACNLHYRFQIIRITFDLFVTAAVALLVLSLSFFAVKPLAVYAVWRTGVAILALSIANLGLRYFPRRSRATTA